MFACGHVGMDVAKTEPAEHSHCCPTPLCQLLRVPRCVYPGFALPLWESSSYAPHPHLNSCLQLGAALADSSSQGAPAFECI